MKRLVTLFFVLAVCGTGAVAQEGAYKTVKDIAYRDAAGDGNIDTMCRLDIYYPVGKTGFSTVVWYHGGGLTGGQREIPEALKDKGLAVVGVEYRLSPAVKVADCVDDAAAAAAWVVKHIASYGGDPGRVFVAGAFGRGLPHVDDRAGQALAGALRHRPRYGVRGADPLQRAGGDAFRTAP